MTRCSYIPTEGQSVIAIAKERGGTTDGDIQALRDRFGCKAEAEWEVSSEASGGPWKEPACTNHVGHLLADGANDVRPYDPAEVAISIVNTSGIAREGFGSPMILAPEPLHIDANRVRDLGKKLYAAARDPIATPVVDLGTNPTRDELSEHGFLDDSTAYREALDRIRKLSEAPDARSRIEASKLAYGTGFGRRHPDGRLEHIPTPEMIVDRMPTPRTGWGEAITERATQPRASHEIVLHSGDQCLLLRRSSVTPGSDGSSATLRIVAPMVVDQFTMLGDWARTQALVRVDGGGPYAIVERKHEGGSHDGWMMTLVLKQIQLDGSPPRASARNCSGPPTPRV